jgi:voltage-gated potassium channel
VKDRLKQIIERTDTVAGRVFDIAIQSLIIVSLISFAVETLPDLSQGFRRALSWMETATVAIFTVEYALRVFVADRKRDYIFSFSGIIDLLAIVPFYLRTGMDLRSVRVFRLLRVFRSFKIFRYSKAIRRFQRAFIIVKEELLLFLMATGMVLYLAAVGIYYFENEAQPEAFGSVFHSLWWAVTTLTTVGYGDVYPITVGGRLFTFLVLMIGLGVVAVPAGLLASALTKAREEET